MRGTGSVPGGLQQVTQPHPVLTRFRVSAESRVSGTDRGREVSFGDVALLHE